MGLVFFACECLQREGGRGGARRLRAPPTFASARGCGGVAPLASKRPPPGSNHFRATCRACCCFLNHKKKKIQQEGEGKRPRAQKKTRARGGGGEKHTPKREGGRERTPTTGTTNTKGTNREVALVCVSSLLAVRGAKMGKGAKQNCEPRGNFFVKGRKREPGGGVVLGFRVSPRQFSKNCCSSSSPNIDARPKPGQNCGGP